MISYNCKMCGGALSIDENSKVCTCEFCETTQTVPNLTDERKARLYERAEHFRKNAEYDKAIAVVDELLNEDSKDAEAYWLRVLCNYGIDYVDDPKTNKKVPTVNRMQYKSIYSDENYKAAIQNATDEQIEVYQNEAKTISYIQKNILKIVQKEAPFDVFISYKSTDEEGKRTVDSVLANDLYHQLVQEGFNVFFSEITLENKFGKDYEPYIFAALNSAKVMLVLGTKPEYFNTVWVKNEWSRFINIVQENKNRALIPCYKNMDPLDLPEEFAHLQIQDMSKLGFITDIIRGIKKLISKENTQIQSPVVTDLSSIVYVQADPLQILKRGNMALEYKDWGDAVKFFDKVLMFDSTLEEARFKNSLARLHISSVEEYEKYLNEKIDMCVCSYDNLVVNNDTITQELISKYEIYNYLDKSDIKDSILYGTGVYLKAPNKIALLKQIQNLDWVKNLEDENVVPYEDAALLYERITLRLEQEIKSDEEIDKKNREDIMAKNKELYDESIAKIEKLYEEATNKRENDYIKGKSLIRRIISKKKFYEGIGRLNIVGRDYKDTGKLIDHAERNRLISLIAIYATIGIIVVGLFVAWGIIS